MLFEAWELVDSIRNRHTLENLFPKNSCRAGCATRDQTFAAERPKCCGGHPQLDSLAGLLVSLLVNMVVSLNYSSQNGGNLYRAPYYNGNPNIGPRIIGNLDQSPHAPMPMSLRTSSHPSKQRIRNMW